MAEYVICDKEEITNIADTIRSATGTTEPMSLQEISDGVKGLKPVQPDWSQNDETAQDYVKNRTHYEEKAEVSIGYDADSDLILEGFPLFAIGDTVTVKIDNIEYSLTAFDDDGYTAIGDPWDDFDMDTGEYGWQIYINNSTVVFYSKENHIISYLGNVVHKIDKKFLPFAEFNMITIIGDYDNDEFNCNLPFEEVYNLVESKDGVVLGIYRDIESVGLFYLSSVNFGYDSFDRKYVGFIFKTLGGDREKEFWYLEDGTLTKSNPFPK